MTRRQSRIGELGRHGYEASRRSRGYQCPVPGVLVHVSVWRRRRLISLLEESKLFLSALKTFILKVLPVNLTAKQVGKYRVK